MSTGQKEMSITRFAANFGRAIGVTIGCLIGMFPLLFLGGREEAKEQEEAEEEKEKKDPEADDTVATSPAVAVACTK